MSDNAPNIEFDGIFEPPTYDEMIFRRVEYLTYRRQLAAGCNKPHTRAKFSEVLNRQAFCKELRKCIAEASTAKIVALAHCVDYPLR